MAEKYDIRTTMMTGVSCKECGNELPPMTMEEHLESRFNKDCPHDYKGPLWEVTCGGGIIKDFYRVMDINATRARITLVRSTKQCDGGNTIDLPFKSNPNYGRIFKARVLKNHEADGSIYQRLRVFCGHGHYMILARKNNLSP